MATATCSANGPCESATNGFASDNVAEVAATCAGTGCRTAIQGEARYGGNSATARSACTAGADGVCQGTGRVGATPTGAEVTAACAGTAGADCAHRYSARSAASDRSSGSTATANARCGAAGGAGNGWCATSAVARTGTGSALAAAACQGSTGSGCSFSYRAHSSAADTGPGTRARASATGSGSGRFGGGQAATTAAAVAGPGSAQASASCTGSAGTRCSHSYSARAAAVAGGGAARASASGSGGGGMGGGGVAVTAQAQAGPGFVSASASCTGSAGVSCRHSYSASVSAAAGNGRSSARASASGSGGGGIGGGGVSVTASASAGPGWAQASASCTGSSGTRCSHSYEATSSAEARDPKTGSHAEAYAHGSGGGGMGGGGVAVSAQAFAKGNQAYASASCSGATNCTATYSAHARDAAHLETADGSWDAEHWAGCSGSGNGGCGVTAVAVAGPKGGEQGGYGTCSGNCANFTQGGSNVLTRKVPPPAATKPKDPTAGVKELGEGKSGIGWKRNDDGSITITSKDAKGKPVDTTCPAPCKPGSPGSKVVGADGRRVEVTDDGVTTSGPSATGKRAHTCGSSEGCGVAVDKAGNGEYWVKGKGEVRDGNSGSRIEYKDSRPTSSTSGPVTNEGHFANRDGTPFTTTCRGGCTGEISNGKGSTDHIDLAGTPNVLVGRDGAGHAATLDFQGKGKITTAEGDVITADGDGLNLDKEWTYATTRDAFGNSGRFQITGGQTGSVQLIEGWRIDQTRAGAVYTFSDKEKLDMLAAGGHLPDSITTGANNGITVVTPNGQGKGGSITCVGDCGLTRPAGMAPTPVCLNCEIFEPLAKKGETPSELGQMTYKGIDDKKREWVDPYGNQHECKADGPDGCRITMQYGPGGGAVCHGKDCSGTNAKGQYLKGEGVLLYPGKNGTDNVGVACRGACESNVENLGWLGDPDESWMAGIDADYVRPSQDTAVDKELAKALGLKEGDPLPPLNRAGLADLEEQDEKQGTNLADEYRKALPELSTAQRDGASLKVTSTLSMLQNRSDKLEGKIEGLRDAVGDYRAAVKGGLTPGEIKALKPQQKVIDEAIAMDQDFRNGRALIDGITGIAYTRPNVDAAAQKMGADPTLPGHQEGFGAYGRNAKGEPLAELSAADKAKANAAQIAGLSLVPRIETLQAQKAAYERDVAALEKSGNATPLDVARMDKRRADINAEVASIGGVEKRIGAMGLPQGVAPDTGTQRRWDVLFTKAGKDPVLADRLTGWNALQNDAAALARQMKRSGDPGQKPFVEKFQQLSGVSELNYNTLARDQGSRAAGSSLGTFPLPSSGRPDIFFTVKSAAGKHLYDGVSDPVQRKFFDEGVKAYDGYDGDPFMGATAADRRAEFAARGTPQEVLNSMSARLTAEQLASLDGSVKDSIGEFADKGAKHDEIMTIFQDPESKELRYMPLYKVTNPDGDTRYIDVKGAHYGDLKDFREHNELFNEETKLLAPADLSKDVGNFDVRTTSGKYVSTTKKWMDRGAGVATFVGVGAMFVAGVFVPPAAPALWTGGAIAAGAGAAYFAGNAVHNIYQRSAHGQSNSWSNPAARSDYLVLGASVLPFAGGAVAKLGARAGAKMAGAAAARAAAVPAGAGRAAVLRAGMNRAVGVRAGTEGVAKAANIGSVAAFGYENINATAQLVRDWDVMGGERKAWTAAGVGMGWLGLGMGGAIASGAVSRPPSGSARGTVDVPLRPEVASGVKRPLIDRVDDVMVRNQAVDIATLADHLNTSPAAVRDALSTATPGARGQGRYQLAQEPTTGAEVVVRAPAATPASGAGAGRAEPAASGRPGRGAESEVPARPTVTAVRNADGTIGFRTPERPAGTAPDGPPVDYIVTARPDGGWNVTTRPVSERPAWQYPVVNELPATKFVETYRSKPTSPLAEAALDHLTRRGGETRQVIGVTVLLATHVLAPDVVGAVAPAPHQPAPAVTHAAKQSGFELGSFGMSAEGSARGGSAPSPRPAPEVGPVIAITPGLERDLANGRLGAMRTVPVTNRALSRLRAPRGVSAREWEVAGPVEKARFWHDLGQSFAQQAKGVGGWPLAYEFAAEAAGRRAMFSAVAAADAYLPSSTRTKDMVIGDLFRRLDTGSMTPPEVETLLQSGWLPSPDQSRAAVDLFAGRHQLAWTADQRGEVADALREVSKLGWRAPTERVMGHGGGSRVAPGARDEQGAAQHHRLAEATGISRLADRTGLTAGQVVDVVRVALQRLQAGAAVPRAGPEPVDALRLDRLQPQELQVLASYGSGRSLGRIAADLGLRRAEAKRSLDRAVEKLGRDGGRLPATEAGTRAEAAAQFASGARSGVWQVRNRLREIEAGLDPAERDALWNTADRIEEWLDRLSPPRRSQAYRELIAARIVSVRELATTSDARLAEAGVSAATVAALRSVLPQDGLSAVAGALAPARDGALGRPTMEALVRQALGVGLSESADRERALAVLHGQLRARHGPLAAAIGQGRPRPGPAARLGLAVPAMAAAGGGALGVLHAAPVPLVVAATGLAMAGAAAVMTAFGPVRARGPPALVKAYLAVGGSAVLGGGFATLGAGDSVAMIAGAVTALVGSAVFGTPRGARTGSAALGTRIASAGPAGVLLALLAVADASAPMIVAAGVGALVGAAAKVTLRGAAQAQIATMPGRPGTVRRAVTAAVLLTVLAVPAVIGSVPPAQMHGVAGAAGELWLPVLDLGWGRGTLIVVGGLTALHAGRALVLQIRDRVRTAVTDAHERPVAGSARVAVARIVNAFGAGPGEAALTALVAADRAWREARQQAERDPAVAGTVQAREQVRVQARQAVEVAAGQAVWDAVRLGVSDRRIARALGRSPDEVRVLTGDVRTALVVPTGRASRWGALWGLVSPVVSVHRHVVAAMGAPVEAARDQMARAERWVHRYRAEVEHTARSGVRWLLNPPEAQRRGEVRGEAHRARVAEELASLGLPRAWLDAVENDPGIAAYPDALGGHPDRHREFETDLALVFSTIAQARERLTRAERKRDQAVRDWHDALATHRDELAVAVRAAVGVGAPVVAVAGATGLGAADVRAIAGGGGPAGPVTGGGIGALTVPPPATGLARGGAVARPNTAARGAVQRTGDPIRGPPDMGWAGRYGAGRTLRTAVAGQVEAWRRWQVAERDAEAALAARRLLREGLEQQAGGLVAIMAGAGAPAVLAGLAPANERVAAALTARDVARAAFVTAVTPAMEKAARDGVPQRVIERGTGLPQGTIAELAKGWEPDSRERLVRVDALREWWVRQWGVVHPPAELILPDGRRVTSAWLAEQFGTGGDAALALLKDGRVVALVSGDRLAVFDLSDGHFHPIGYDDPRGGAYIEGHLRKLADSGHQGVITFHPIPQRGKGLAGSGGAFYYGIVNVVTLGLVYNVRILEMWGQFPDVRMLDTIRRLPPDLRWRAVMGSVGARMDIPGALNYLRLLAVMNPDLLKLIGETTIAKELVRVLLGEQGIHTINPRWLEQIERLVAGAGLLRTAVADPDVALTAADLPAGLAEVVTGPRTDPERVAVALLPALLGHLDDIKTLLERTGHGAAAKRLLSAAEQSKLDVFNAHLRELLAAVEEIGLAVVLHNDFGLARILANARVGETTPDERFGMPLLNLLAEYPTAKIVLAHLGVGKYTRMSVEHLDVIDEILSNPRYSHISFDISWNDVARHLLADKAITDRFIQLVRDHPDRLIYGSDGVFPASVAQNSRHAHDMEPIFVRIRDEVGHDAFHDVRHANLERRLAAAERDVQAWAYAQQNAAGLDAWRRAAFSAERNRIVDDWRERYELEQGDGLRRTLAELGRPDPGRWWEETGPAARQMHSLVRWHNAVTLAVVDGRRLTPRMVVASLRAIWADRRGDRADRHAAKQAARAEAGLGGTTDTAALGLRDADGNAYTLEALVAAHQTSGAMGDQARAAWVLGEVQRTQLAQTRDAAGRRELRGAYTAKAIVAAAVMVGLGAVAATVAPGALLPMAASAHYAAFAVRGALGLHRTAYNQELRVLVESIMERGQFDIGTIRVLISVMRKYAALDGSTPKQLARFDEVANEFLVIAHALVFSPLRPGQTAQGRQHAALKEFSLFLDKAAVELGAQAQSFQGFAPNAGLLGRVVNTVLAGTYLVNLAVQVEAMANGTGLAVWVNGAFALSSVLFLVQALSVTVMGWAGIDFSSHPLLRRVVHLGAIPAVTVGSLLLTIQTGVIDNSILVLPALGLTAAGGYLSALGITIELGHGRPAPRRGAGANAVLFGSLLAFGVMSMLPDQVVGLGIGAGVLLVGTWALSAFDTWRSRRTRGPPSSGAPGNPTSVSSGPSGGPSAGGGSGRPGTARSGAVVPLALGLGAMATTAALGLTAGPAVLGLGVVVTGIVVMTGSGSLVGHAVGDAARALADRIGPARTALWNGLDALRPVVASSLGWLRFALLGVGERQRAVVESARIARARERLAGASRAGWTAEQSRAGRRLHAELGQLGVDAWAVSGGPRPGAYRIDDLVARVDAAVAGVDALVPPAPVGRAKRLRAALRLLGRAPVVVGLLTAGAVASDWIGAAAAQAGTRVGTADAGGTVTGGWWGGATGLTVAGVTVAVGLVLGLRGWWTPRQARAPPAATGPTGTRTATRLLALARSWVANRAMALRSAGTSPVPNAVVGDLVDLAPGNPPRGFKVTRSSARSDEELLTSVFAPADGQFLATHPSAPGILLQGNHRRYELIRRADDPGSAIDWDTPIYINRLQPNPTSPGPAVARRMARLFTRHGPPITGSRPATSGDLRRVAAEMTVHPDGHGAILAPPADPLRAHALDLPVDPRDFTLVAHADRGGVRYPAAGPDVRIGHDQLAQLLTDIPEFTAWRDSRTDGAGRLVVCGCEIAVDTEAALRSLAATLGVPVAGADAVVLVHPATGTAPARVSLGSRADGTPGRWYLVERGRAASEIPAPTGVTATAAARLGPPGVTASIPPGAGPVRAGTGDADAAPPLTAQQLEIIDREVLRHGHQLVKTPQTRIKFQRDPHRYAREASWVAAVVGDVLEGLAAPVMERLATERGEQVLKNVVARLVNGSGSTGDLVEFDFLFLDDSGPVRYVSAKANPKTFAPGADRAKLAKLFSEIPTESPEALRAYLAYLRLNPATLANIVGVEVSWSGSDGAIPLAEFRRLRVRGVDASDVAIEMMTPAGPKARGHHIDLTRDELVDAVIAGIGRRIAAIESREG
ncbi:DUF4781 domain-containing protein [Pseudonocardia xinjiangensis]|uniref:DUF4781 domain-containing protein n=1 Tax=Pseudonocardia xinjiangensis TaxID=75289 RepID=UPI003D8FE320